MLLYSFLELVLWKQFLVIWRLYTQPILFLTNFLLTIRTIYICEYLKFDIDLTSLINFIIINLYDMNLNI